MKTNNEQGKEVSTIGGPNAGRETGRMRRGITPTGVIVEGYAILLKNDWYIVKFDRNAGAMCYYVKEVLACK